MAGENTSNFMEQGGSNWEIGGTLSVATVDVTDGLAKLAPSNRGEVVAATNTITAAESGKVFFLNHATEFVSTLPTAALGLRYTFIVANVPESASYTIVTASSANTIFGHVLSSEDAGGTSDYETSGGDTISFVDGKADLGDRVDVECDGTNWYARCSCAQYDAITITTAS